MENKTDDKITEAVVDDLRSRSKVGIKKYNTTLDQNNKDDYMTHLYQESWQRYSNTCQMKLEITPT